MAKGSGFYFTAEYLEGFGRCIQALFQKAE
jgi:hypothetical protein